MSDQSHWDKVYLERGEDGVSWFQAEPTLSLELIAAAGLGPGARVLDIGGGASRLVDLLLVQGLKVDVLDISEQALRLSRERLGPTAGQVAWHRADITEWEPEAAAYDLWHDRAVFHFLVTAEQRAAYVRALDRGLKPGGHVVLASFAPDGPLKCSGLDVCRYDAAGLQKALGTGYQLLREEAHEHTTPWDSAQKFRFFLLKKPA